MSNYFYGLMLVILGLLPNYQVVERGEEALRSQLIDKPKDTLTASYNIPDKSESFIPKEINSTAGVFLDAESGKILIEKNKNQRLPMASTTKMMTALIVVEKLPLNRPVTVSGFETRPLDTTMGLSVGDRLTVLELLHGLLIESGSDAAQVLAKEVAGAEPEFVALMNERASQFGLKDTQFTNSVGYDSINHYSTAYDLAKLAKVFLLNKTLKDIVAKTSYTAKSENGKQYFLSNTNKLLNGSYRGLKTGTTYAAGECLVSYYDSGEQKVIGVLLNSPSRFSETSAIIEWTKHNYLW